MTVITFRVSRRRREMYSGHARLCVYVSVPRRIPHHCTNPDVTVHSRGRPLVVHCWADLQSLHGFRCYDDIERRKMSASALYSLYA